MKRLSAIAVSCLGFLALIQFVHGRPAALEHPPALGPEWVEEDDSLWGVLDHSWKLSSDPRVFASVMTHSQSSFGAKLSRATLPQFLSEFSEGRLVAMSLQGISDWKIERKDFEQAGDRKTLTLRGSYTDLSDTPVTFEEVHSFDGTRYSVAALIYPAESEFAKAGGSSEILAKMGTPGAKGAEQ